MMKKGLYCFGTEGINLLWYASPFDKEKTVIDEAL